MNIVIIDNGTMRLKELYSMLCKHRVTTYTYNAHYLIDESTDLAILTGSSNVSLFSHINELKNEIDLIKKSTIPIIGICLGCELIAYAFGANIKYLGLKERGITKILIIDKAFLMTRLFMFMSLINGRSKLYLVI